MDKDRNGGKEAEREVKEAADEGKRMWEEWDQNRIKELNKRTEQNSGQETENVSENIIQKTKCQNLKNNGE